MATKRIPMYKAPKTAWTPKQVTAVLDRLPAVIGPLSRVLFNGRALADIEALYRVRALARDDKKRLAQIEASLDRAFAALANDAHGGCLGFDAGGGSEMLRKAAENASKGVK